MYSGQGLTEEEEARRTTSLPNTRKQETSVRYLLTYYGTGTWATESIFYSTCAQRSQVPSLRFNVYSCWLTAKSELGQLHQQLY